MREFARLPPLVRVVGIVGILFPLVGIAWSVFSFVGWRVFSSPLLPLDSVRVGVIGTNLVVFSLVCMTVVAVYRMRVRPPARAPFLLTWWQMRVIAVVAALSLGTLVLAVILPPTPLAFVTVLPLCNIAAMGVMLGVLVATFVGTSRQGAVE